MCGSERATAAEGYVGARCWQQVRFIRPPLCERCGFPFEGEITGAFECSNCRDMKLDFVSARSAVAAKGVVLEAIHRYKYQRALWFEPFLVDLLVRQAAPVLERESWHLIVPVPLYPVKQREREFNQAERIAARFSAAAHVPVNAHLLRRIKPTQTQTLLARSARQANVRGAFDVQSKTALKGQRIVLVDDVFTTGATTNACAKTLVTAGAGAVCVWTVARGL